jgi:hypothetical protein
MNALANLTRRLPFQYPASELDRAFALADEEIGREEAASLADEREVYLYDTRAIARAASPVALTWGGIAGGAILIAGGSPVAAIAAGFAALVLVAVVVEASLRRTAA